MSRNTFQSRNRVFIVGGLGVALLVAVSLSPLASQNPDGLDRVSLPFYGVFDEYALRGVPEGVATPLAGFVGTLVVFGLAWGFGKLVVRNSGSSSRSSYTDSDQPPKLEEVK